MKIKSLVLGIVVSAMFSCSKPSFNVNVDLQNAEGKMVYMQKVVDNDVVVIDSTTIKNNKATFIVENGNTTTRYSIKIDGARYPIGFFSENKDVNIIGDFNDNRNIIAHASNAQQLINEYNAENKKFNERFNELHQEYRTATQLNDQAAIERIENEYNKIENNKNNYQTLFLTKNSNSFVAPYILYNNRYNYELTELEDFVNNFNINEENDYSKLLDEYIAILQRVDVGQPYLDFRASWCGPCRVENPNVVEVYNEYHEKGFDVLGVSLDMQKENWIKAIEDDGLIWHNISDLKYWNNEAAKSYGISSIPSNLLLDENGIIIAKNLRGEDLRKKVNEILK